MNPLLNPVELQLVKLRGYWEEFNSKPDKRLLIWQSPENSLRLLQAFFEAQKHETAYSTGDLFIVFNTPYHYSIQYSRELKQSLFEQYEASRDDFKQQGIEGEWEYNIEDYIDSANGFVRCVESFHKHFQSVIGRLVVVLFPTGIDHNVHYNAWLKRNLAADIPDNMRFVVIDDLQHPRHNIFIEENLSSVATQKLELDILNVAQETFAKETTVGPAGVFRNLLTGLMTLVDKGSADDVITKSTDAFAFAEKYQWQDQQVVLNMLVASALLKEKRFEESIDTYRKARELSTKLVEGQHPAGNQLVTQTWFCEAGAYIGQQDHANSARCYDEAAEVARHNPNALLRIEALRMSAFFYNKLDQPQTAINRLETALGDGEKMNPEVRSMTLLPLVAFNYLQLTDKNQAAKIETLKHRMNKDSLLALDELEHRSAELDKTSDNQCLLDLEKTMHDQIEVSADKAQVEVDKLATSGSDSFSKAYERGKSLLGDDWPLHSNSAILPKTEAA